MSAIRCCFMENILGSHPGELHWLDFFSIHEGLHLPYEQAQTRVCRARPAGTTCDATSPGSACARPTRRALTSSTSGIRNPVAVKVARRRGGAADERRSETSIRKANRAGSP